uniref:type I restriction endonuclease subunit R, EcoR124 family n=1 Tax=Thiolapillus sp. TaxID=2017437 RepID=UPI003AF9E450
LDQYTDLDPELRETIDKLLPEDDLRAFRGVYLDVAQELKASMLPRSSKPGRRRRQTPTTPSGSSISSSCCSTLRSSTTTTS